MNETRTMDEIQRGLLKRFHSLCGVLGMTYDEKCAILESYGVESSRDLDQHQIIDICAKLSEQADAMNGKENTYKLRKRVFAAIGGWLRFTGKAGSVGLIKGIACRATGYDDFNKIPRERLRNLIGLFNAKLRDAQAVGRMDEVGELPVAASGTVN